MLGLISAVGRRVLGFRERRRTERYPASAPAMVMTSGQTYPCTTVNLSEGGAQLLFEAANGIAGFIELRIPSMRIKTHARVVWCDDGRMGVEFVI